MNNVESIIQHIASDTPKNGWAVFRFNPVSTWFAIAWQIFAICLSAGAAYMFLLMPITVERTQENMNFGYGATVLLVLFAVGFVFSIRRIVSAKNTFIVITDDLIVKSFCGNVEEYPIAHISKLQLTQLRGTSGFKLRYLLEFVDTRTNRFVVLAEKRYFGDESVIFNTLNSKL